MGYLLAMELTPGPFLRGGICLIIVPVCQLRQSPTLQPMSLGVGESKITSHSKVSQAQIKGNMTRLRAFALQLQVAPMMDGQESRQASCRLGPKLFALPWEMSTILTYFKPPDKYHASCCLDPRPANLTHESDASGRGSPNIAAFGPQSKLWLPVPPTLNLGLVL